MPDMRDQCARRFIPIKAVYCWLMVNFVILHLFSRTQRIETFSQMALTKLKTQSAKHFQPG
jgi:beta-lactamase regulating signal transducer with metallopeptidase domain